MLEEAAKLDLRNSAAFNQLANYYGHRGPINLAFEDYEKAIAIDPMESVYYWNLATTVYLYRKDSREYYHLTEQQVFDKAMGLYGKALELDPTNFTLATDLAESYYAIKPFRPEAALVAWTNALNIANNEIEREGVYVHLARVKYLAGDFAQARAQLLEVTNKMYAELKRRLTRNMDEKEGKGTNAPVSAPGLVSNGAASSSETNRAAVAPPAGIKP